MKWRLFIAVGFLFTACTQTASPSVRLAEASPGPTTPASNTPIAMDFGGYDLDAVHIELLDSEPIKIELPSLQNFDGIGSLYQDQGVYYALIGGFDQDTHFYYVYQAVSQDGSDWVINESDLTAHDLFEGGNCVPRESLRTDEGQWIYYAQCSQGTNLEESAYIIYLTAPEFTGPWTWYPAPIVGGDTAEDRPVWFLDIFELNPGYRMYFYYPITNTIGVAESEDGITWQVLGEQPQDAESEPVFRLHDANGNEIYPRRIESVWQEGDIWYMVYLELRSSEASAESYTPTYGLATGPDGLRWIRSAEVILPETEVGPLMIITSMLAAESKLIASLCRWAENGGMTCYIGEAEKPVTSNQ
jgi:hypothetical protein